MVVLLEIVLVVEGGGEEIGAGTGWDVDVDTDIAAVSTSFPSLESVLALGRGSARSEAVVVAVGTAAVVGVVVVAEVVAVTEDSAGEYSQR